MHQIVYSLIVQEKLAALKLKLIELYEEKTGKKRLSAVINDLEVRLTFSNIGTPVKIFHICLCYDRLNRRMERQYIADIDSLKREYKSFAQHNQEINNTFINL